MAELWLGSQFQTQLELQILEDLLGGLIGLLNGQGSVGGATQCIASMVFLPLGEFYSPLLKPGGAIGA